MADYSDQRSMETRECVVIASTEARMNGTRAYQQNRLTCNAAGCNNAEKHIPSRENDVAAKVEVFHLREPFNASQIMSLV